MGAQHAGKENLLAAHARLQNDKKEKAEKAEKAERKKSVPKKRKPSSGSKDSLSGREMRLVQEAFAAGSKHQKQQQFPSLQLNVNVLQLNIPDGLGELSKGDGMFGADPDFGGFGAGQLEDDDGNETDDNSDESMPSFTEGAVEELFMDDQLLGLGSDIELFEGMVLPPDQPRIKPEGLCRSPSTCTVHR